MSPFASDRTIAGVDGCRFGWIAAIAAPGEPPRLEPFRDFGRLLAALPADAAVAVDMPIGLPERIGKGGREAEAAARAWLKRSKSSVFPIPSRRAVHAEPGPWPDAAARKAAHARACTAARETSDPPRGFSIQTFGILPKIRELDGLLLAEPGLCSRILESHPELAFQRLGGGAPPHPKSSRQGEAEREALLLAQGMPERLLHTKLPGVGRDDLLDACALLFTAARFVRGEAKSFPETFGRDAHGLPIAIWI